MLPWNALPSNVSTAVFTRLIIEKPGGTDAEDRVLAAYFTHDCLKCVRRVFDAKDEGAHDVITSPKQPAIEAPTQDEVNRLVKVLDVLPTWVTKNAWTARTRVTELMLATCTHDKRAR
jgi:hypothetical protein